MRKYTLVMLCAVLFFGETSLAQKSELPLWKTIPVIPVMPKADESGFVKVNDIKMYYAIYNKSGKEPVILLHGGLGNSDDWGFETPLLQKKHEVIVVDCRGRGRSTMSDQPLSYDLMTSDLLGLMDQLHLKKVSIVGVSDGGVIGLLMAIHHPERIDKLFAYGANFNNSGYTTVPPDTALSHKYMRMAEASYRALSSTPEGFIAMRKALFKMYDTEPDIKPSELQTIKAPTIIADGEYEQFITPEHTELLAHLIPGATLLIIPNVSHGGPIQDPASFHKAVMNLLN